MKAFRFRLEALLKYRTMQKEQAQADLIEAAAALRKEQSVLASFEQKWDENMEILREQRQSSTRNKAEIFKLYELYFDKLKRDIYSQQEKVAEAGRFHELCMAALAEALKKEKVVEKFREKKHQQYLQECLAEEQKALDEIGLQIYVRENKE